MSCHATEQKKDVFFEHLGFLHRKAGYFRGIWGSGVQGILFPKVFGLPLPMGSLQVGKPRRKMTEKERKGASRVCLACS